MAKPAFVGRDDALAAVTAALDAGAALVLIQGEPGIGKTRLVREARTHMESSAPADGPGRRVLLTGCPPLIEPLPLGAVVDGLRRLGKQIGGIGELELSKLGGALRPLFPEWADELPPPLEELGDPKETRRRLFSALTELIDRLGVEVLVVEDLHWADTPTLEWLLTLTTAEPVPDGHKMSIVGSYRPTDIPDGSLLRRLISRAPTGLNLLRVDLEPLDVVETQRLVASMFGTDGVSTEFAEFLHQRTDGVPLAVEECVLLLRDRHDIVRRGPAWIRRMLGELEVPAAVRDSVLERIERLDPDTRQILHAAAILGEPADEAILATVAELDEETARRGVAFGLDSGLLLESSPARYELRHALDAQAIAEAIPVSERRRLHQRAGEVLQAADPPPVARLARHFREAGEVEQWCHYAEAAADLALKSGDDHTAVVTLLDLLNAIEHPLERRLRLTRKLGEAAFFGAAALGDLAQQAVDVLRGVLDAADLSQGERGELRLLLGRMLWQIGQRLTSFEEMEAAIADLEHRPDLAMLAMSNLALPWVPDWPASRHLYWLDRAGELARQDPASDWLALANSRATALLLLGEQAGWQAVYEIPTVAVNPGERRRLAPVLLNIAGGMAAWGRYGDARRQVAAAAKHIHETDYQRYESALRIGRAYLDWYTGAWEGLDTAAKDLAVAEASDRLDQLNARQILGLLELVAGARASARKRLHDVVDEYARLGVVQPWAALGSAALGRLHLADGAAEKALQVTEPVMAMIARKQVWLWATDLAPVHLDTLIAAGRTDQADDIAGRFAVGLGDVDAPAPQAALTTCQAILAEAKGELSEAVDLFADAAEAWAGLPRPYDELLASERRGRCLLAVGQQDEALDVLTEAKERLDQLGARWDADRLAQLLRGHGVDVARAWRGGRRGYGDQLSPREQEVVGLVAQGMTNKEIAKTLFLSPRTVERHLRHAMRKLDVSSRTALAMAASEAGLIADGSPPPPGTGQAPS